MHIEKLESETLWKYYQRGYHVLLRSGRYFRQVLRPALSHVFFQRAMPLLVEYSRANRGVDELPPGFQEQMEACPLTARDLLHLDYAISLGYAELLMQNSRGCEAGEVMTWPGPESYSGTFIASDATLSLVATAFTGDPQEDEDDFTDLLDPDDEENSPPFDL